MKTKFVLVSFIAALSSFAALANTAKAGTDLRINLNLGLPRPPVIVVSGSNHSSYVAREPAPRGYWKEVVVKTWVPARWIVSCDRRGRETRTLERAHFAYRTDRVWVDYGRGAGSYGYANR